MANVFALANIGSNPYATKLKLIELGARLDGTTADYLAFQAFFDYIYAEAGYGNKLDVDFGCLPAVVNIGGPLKLNSDRLGDVNWGRTHYKCADSVTTMRVTAENDNSSNFTALTPFGQANMYMHGGRFFGPGLSSNAKCIQFNQPVGTSPTDPGPSRVGIGHMYIRGFQTGIDHHNHAYAEYVEHVEISSCFYAVRRRYNSIDSGEAITYNKVTMFGCVNIFDVEGGANKAASYGTWFKFVACSFDYSQCLVAVRGGAKVELISCHFEGDGTLAYTVTTAPFYREDPGSTISVIGGEIVYPKQTDPVTGFNRQIAYIVHNNGPASSGGIFFYGTDMCGTNTTTGDFDNPAGLGLTVVENATSLTDQPSAPVVCRLNNRFADGKPTLAAFCDAVQISNDGADPAVTPITNYRTGSNVTIVNSAALSSYPAGITRAWRINKIGNSSTSAKVLFLAPINGRSRHAVSMYLRKSVAGTVTINPVYAIARPLAGAAAGVLEVLKQVAASGSMTMGTSHATNFVRVDSPNTGRLTPFGAGMSGATHFGFEIDMGVMNTHDLDVCDVWGNVS